MLNEGAIIHGCIKNDKKAQKALFDKYAPTLLGICMRYAHNRTEAEDVLQQSLVKIYFKINQYSKKGSFEGWMKHIVTNTAITYYHQNLKYYKNIDIDNINEIDSNEYTINNYNHYKFSEEKILAIINELPDGYRIIFNLYAIEGYKHKEIAEMLNIEVSTSKSQYSRARKIIQKKLTDIINTNDL